MRKTAFSFLACLTLAALVGCGGGAPAPGGGGGGGASTGGGGASTKKAGGGGGATTPYAVDKGTASIKGTVSLEGEVPKAATAKIDMSTNKDCEAAHGGEAKKEEIIANGGKLANVVVYVKSGAEKWTYDSVNPPAATISQKGCQYIPHVLAVKTGQTVTISNDDPLAHNVHGKPKDNKEFNYSQSQKGQKHDYKFTEPEIGVSIQCDVHKWMVSYACVFDHPFYAVTDDKGNFEIKGLPPGDYEIATWHESPRVDAPASAKVTVADKDAKTQDFTYKVSKK